MAKAINERKESLKVRIAMLLCLIGVYVHAYNECDFPSILRITAIGMTIGTLIAVLIIRLRLVYKPIIKGICGIVAGVSIFFWKIMDSYSVTLELIILLSIVIMFLILSFKYSAAELEQREPKQNTEERPAEK